MTGALANPLAAWESFYVIVGSSAAALTGLQFVVITLAADTKSLGGEAELSAFGTPTIVHFCAALLISALLSAPWHSLGRAAFTLGVGAFVGIIYAISVIRTARRQTGYKPVLEDWLWHAVFPLISYVAIFVAALTLRHDPVESLFSIGAIALFLLFIGIHNAWDAVTFFARRRQGEPPSRPIDGRE